MRGKRSLFAVFCCLLAMAFAGCGGDSTSSSSTTSAQDAATQPSADASSGSEAAGEGPESSFAPNPYREPGTPGAHPHASVDRLIVREVKRGRGLAARPGDSIYADYIGANYTTGHKFLRAWGHGTFPTEGMLLQVPNWMRGLVVGMTGMRPGGRRIIIVPRRLSDVDDPDRPNSYHQIVYWDVVLRLVQHPQG